MTFYRSVTTASCLLNIHKRISQTVPTCSKWNTTRHIKGLDFYVGTTRQWRSIVAAAYAGSKCTSCSYLNGACILNACRSRVARDSKLSRRCQTQMSKPEVRRMAFAARRRRSVEPGNRKMELDNERSIFDRAQARVRGDGVRRVFDEARGTITQNKSVPNASGPVSYTHLTLPTKRIV